MISPHCEEILKNFEDISKRKSICWDFRMIRAAVMCMAWKYMETKHMPFRAAISEAWRWAKEKCAEAGAYI